MEIIVVPNGNEKLLTNILVFLKREELLEFTFGNDLKRLIFYVLSQME